MGFSDIIGQKNQLAILRSALAAGRLHHAYLFLGAAGLGKHTVALSLAKTIHCSELANDFCGRCINCLRINDGNHPDVRVIEPLTGKKEISIQQIRELERELGYRSFTGKHKIAIIDPATAMNLSSQNALLKTLEEPPKDTLMILIAESSGGLLPTLRSRCLRITFAPLTRQEVAAYLESKHGMNSVDAEFVAALSMGSIGAGLSLRQADLVENRRIWSGMLGSLKTADYHGAMIAAEALARNRDDALKFLRWAESWYRDLLIFQVSQNSDELINIDMRAQIEEQSSANDLERSLRAVSQISRATGRIQRNLNRRMVFEKFLFRVVGER